MYTRYSKLRKIPASMTAAQVMGSYIPRVLLQVSDNSLDYCLRPHRAIYFLHSFTVAA